MVQELWRKWSCRCGAALLAVLTLAVAAEARFQLQRGDLAPPIGLTDTAGRPVAASGPTPSILLFVHDGQPRSAQLLAALATLGEAVRGARVVVVASPRGPLPVLPAGFSAVLAADGDGATFKAYGVVMTPTTVVVDPQGKVVVVIANQPENFSARLGAALAAAAGNPFDEALLSGGEAPAVAAAHDHLADARALAGEGKIEAALAAATAAVAADPSEVVARQLMGDLQLATGDAAAARATFEQILRDHPHLPAAEIGLGQALLATGGSERAVEILRQATRTNPNPVRAHYALGRFYEGQQRWDEAVAEYRAALVKLKEGRR